MKYYVTADIHGFFKEFYAALEKSGYFTETAPHKLIILGDLFDRGKEPEKLQEFVVDLIAKDGVILIKGNHEDLMEELVSNAPMWYTTSIQYTHHFTNGTVKTMLQLIGDSLQHTMVFPELAANRMRHTPFFKVILPAMRNYYETKNYIFVHGYIPCGTAGKPVSRYFPREGWRSASEEEWSAARWYNGMEAAGQGVMEEGKTIVCGHFHTSYGHSKFEGKGDEFGKNADFSPYSAKGVLAIDACTAFSKRVNVVIIEDEE